LNGLYFETEDVKNANLEQDVLTDYITSLPQPEDNSVSTGETDAVH